jgi:hypothetical protein
MSSILVIVPPLALATEYLTITIPLPPVAPDIPTLWSATAATAKCFAVPATGVPEGCPPAPPPPEPPAPPLPPDLAPPPPPPA